MQNKSSIHASPASTDSRNMQQQRKTVISFLLCPGNLQSLHTVMITIYWISAELGDFGGGLLSGQDFKNIFYNPPSPTSPSRILDFCPFQSAPFPLIRISSLQTFLMWEQGETLNPGSLSVLRLHLGSTSVSEASSVLTSGEIGSQGKAQEWLIKWTSV